MLMAAAMPARVRTVVVPNPESRAASSSPRVTEVQGDSRGHFGRTSGCDRKRALVHSSQLKLKLDLKGPNRSDRG